MARGQRSADPKTILVLLVLIGGLVGGGYLVFDLADTTPLQVFNSAMTEVGEWLQEHPIFPERTTVTPDALH